MRIRAEQAEEEPPINMTPLIDMVFLLLIFFLVATTFAQEEREINVQLPGTTLLQPISAPPRQVIINIMSDGEVKVSGRIYSREELEAMLRGVVRDQPDREILIRADERSIVKYFAGVASLCRKVGIGELKLGYILEAPQPVAVQ